MPARPSWRGQIKLALVSIPVEIYPATKAGKLVSPTRVTPCLTTVLPGSVSGQLPPCGAARSTMTEPAFMACTISGVTSTGAGRPGMSAVVMTTSACATRLATSTFCRSSQLAGMGRA